MAKRARKVKQTQEEIDAIEAQRIAAHTETEQDNEAPEGTEATPPSDEARENGDEVGEMEPQAVEADAEGEPSERIEDEEKPITTVVLEKYKERYVANAIAAGVSGKAAKRSNWDWLSQQIALYCLDDKHKIRMDNFVAILDANGVDHSKWTNRNKGWEGRFRMTGRVVLQKVVANAGLLLIPDGDSLVAPAEFVEKYKTKA